MLRILVAIFFFVMALPAMALWEGSGGGSNGAGAMPNFAINDGTPATSHFYGQYLLNGNTTVASITGNFTVATTCTNAIVTLYDCGTSAGTCASPSATVGTLTFSSSTLNTAINGVVTGPNLLTGHYLGAKLTTLGGCSNIVGNINAVSATGVGNTGPPGSGYAASAALTNAPACLSTSGTNPSKNVYAGTIAGGSGDAPVLPSTCADQSIIEYNYKQAASPLQPAFSTGASGGIVIDSPYSNGTCPALGTPTGSLQSYIFTYQVSNSSWLERCPLANPLSAYPNAASTSGFIDDINNNLTLAARNAANTGDIPLLSTDNTDDVQLGGTNANQIEFNSNAVNNNGQLSSGAYLHQADTRPNYGGSNTETCANTIHNYTLVSNATINLNCSTSTNHNLFYRFFQPASGTSFFSYTFIPQAGAKLLGDNPPTAPSPCMTNGCIDEVSVEWIPDAPTPSYIVNVVKQAITGGGGGGGGGTGCPAGSRCRFVDYATGNDTWDGTSGTFVSGTTGPWKTIDKASNDLLNMSNAVSTTQDVYLLFKSGTCWPGTGGTDCTVNTKVNNLNHPMWLGDTNQNANFKAVGLSAQHPIYITTYGGSGRAIFDMKNIQPYCFTSMQSASASPVSGTFKYVNVSNIECRHAYGYAVDFQVNGSDFTGGTGSPTDNAVVVNNLYVHNIGFQCSDNDLSTCNGAITGGEGVPAAKINGHAYVAQDATHTSLVLAPGTNDWWYVTAGCTAGTGTAFPTTGLVANSSTYNDGGCTWTFAGVRVIGYDNAVQWYDTAGIAVASAKFSNNFIQNTAGHNMLEVDGDVGSPVIMGNVLGPGSAPHGGIDSKMTGDYTTSPPRQAQIIGNTVSCGYSLGLCSCQIIAANGGAACGTGSNAQTPMLFHMNVENTNHDNILYEGNVVYDSQLGIQTIISGNGTDSAGCANTANTCPVRVAAYHNTFHLGQVGGFTSVASICFYSSTGTSPRAAGSTIDFRDNICDGTTTLFNVGVGGTTDYTSVQENHNDLGGSGGYVNTYSFHGSSTIPSTDLVCKTSCAGSAADPKYDCEVTGGSACYVAAAGPPLAVTPNYNLQTGSPVSGARTPPLGVTGLGVTPWSGYSGIGAFN